MNKQQIIILTGHDRGGKSTIAKELSRRLNIPYFKVKRDKYWWDPSTNLTYLTEGITQFIEMTGCSVIIDRWHCDDYMYSKLFDRDISYRKIANIDLRLSKLNTLIVYCAKDEDRYIDDVEDIEFVNKTMYLKMTNLYDEYSKISKCRYMWLNTSDENIENQIKAITKELK